MHLAQANVAWMRASYDDPLMDDFLERLDPVNAIADDSPGFVWRLTGDDVDPRAQKIFGVDNLLFNMSVWESVEALEHYVYKSGHIKVLQKRSKWFEKMDRSPFVLWWIDEGHIPSIEEAKQRFELLWNNGPTPEAFTFSSPRRTAR